MLCQTVAERYFTDSWIFRFILLTAKKGIITDSWNNGLAATLEVMIPKNRNLNYQNYPTIYWGWVPWGYAWSFPGEQHQIMGMCTLTAKAGRSLNACFNRFIAAQCNDLHLKKILSVKLLRYMQKRCEETIQGKRTLKWLRCSDRDISVT